MARAAEAVARGRKAWCDAWDSGAEAGAGLEFRRARLFCSAAGVHAETRGALNDCTLETDSGCLLTISMQTIESIYIMWQTTGDTRWRERGWLIFEAIEKEAKTAAGYAMVGNVEQSLGPKQDGMPRCVPVPRLLCSDTCLRCVAWRARSASFLPKRE